MSRSASRRIDVGLVTYRTRDLTVEAIRRLLGATGGLDVRILVHDNASGDGTVEAIHEQLPSVDVEAGIRNVGFAAGMNRLLARSDSPWFVALNSDAWPVDASTLSRLLDTATATPRAAIVAPLIRRPDGGVEHSTHPFPSVPVALAGAVGFGSRFGRGWGRRHCLYGAWQHDVRRPVDWAVGAAWLMRREAVEQVGGFDESFFMYAEDLEWCWRATRAGWQVWFEPDAVVEHVGNASGGPAYGQARAAAWVGNTYRFYRPRHGAASAAAYQGLNAVGAARAALRFRVQGQPERSAYWWRLARTHLHPTRGSDQPGEGTG